MQRKLAAILAIASFSAIAGGTSSYDGEINRSWDPVRCKELFAALEQSNIEHFDDKKLCQFGASNYAMLVKSHHFSELEWHDLDLEPSDAARKVVTANESPKDAQRFALQDAKYIAHVAELAKGGHISIQGAAVVIEGRQRYLLKVNSNVCGADRYGVPYIGMFTDGTYSKAVPFVGPPLGVPMYLDRKLVLLDVVGDRWYALNRDQNGRGGKQLSMYAQAFEAGLNSDGVTRNPNALFTSDYCSISLFQP